MSSSQQRHAIMLKNFDSAIVQSGIEGMYSEHTSFLYTAKDNGTVIYKNKDILIVKYENGLFETLHVGYRKLYINVLDFYHVYYNVGDTFTKGVILAESNFMKSGKICLGKNLRVCITPYRGYNYEDAIVLSERVRKEKLFSSVHYKEIVIEVPKNKVLLNITDNKNTYKVIPEIGDIVKRGDVIAKLKTVDKERYTSVIFEKCQDIVSDEDCEIIDVKVYANKWNTDFEQFNDFVKSSIQKNKTERENLVSEVSEYLNSDELEQLVSILDINKTEKNNYKYKGDIIDGVRIELTVKYERELQIGDKLANRHGNKGTISKFIPEEEMPINMEDGSRADIIINPLGIVSRMNIGQVFECHLSEAVMNLRKKCLNMLTDNNSIDSVK
jgi:DNA-directed RNA polymerase subunit beta